MQTVLLGKQFGKFLLGRQEGMDAFSALESITEQSRKKKEKVFCDFSGVLVLNSSFADEMFGMYERKYPSILLLDDTMNSACKKAFEVITEVHGVNFTFATGS